MVTWVYARRAYHYMQTWDPTISNYLLDVSYQLNISLLRADWVAGELVFSLAC